MVKALIYGAGAIGSFLASLLSSPNDYKNHVEENVGLLGRRGHMQRIRENGLEIKSSEGTRTLYFQHCFSEPGELRDSTYSPDVVIVCVKTHSLPALSKELKQSGLLDGKLKRAEFILLMNGMGNRESLDLSGDLSGNQVFEGITSMGVVFSEEGKIELKGKAKTILEAGISPEIRSFFQERFEEKGFEIEFEFASDFKIQQWNKLFANAVINPITALVGKKNGIVLSEDLRKTVEDIVDECVEAAAREGLEFDRNRVLDFVYSVASKTSNNISSMLQDVRRGNKTEIDSINGYVVGLGKRHGLKVPVNRTLYELVKAVEDRNFGRSVSRSP
jgi:2-dehydropantoate 2-reductase